MQLHPYRPYCSTCGPINPALTKIHYRTLFPTHQPEVFVSWLIPWRK
jgi:hypothetical protein